MMVRREEGTAHHGFYVRMWDSVELVKVELQFRADVDVGALVLRAVTIFGC